MDRLELYKDMYKREVERRNELNNELSIPIGLITILATAIFFYLTSFDFTINKLLTIVFLLFFSSGLGFLLYSIWCLIKAYNIFTGIEAYSYTPYPEDLEKYFIDFKAYLLRNGIVEPDATTRTEEEFQNYMQDLYIKNATKNTTINETRSTYLFQCKVSMSRAMVLLLITFIPFCVNYFAKPKEPQKVQIVSKVYLTCNISKAV